MQFCQLLLGVLVVVDVVLREGAVNCDDGNFFLKAAKSVPRIGRSGKNANDDMFEKFFLKASKSVPRIGRRGPPQTSWNEEDKYIVNNVKYPLWSEISDRFENDPELFAYPHLLQQLEQTLGDDLSVYDVDRVRMKRTNAPAKFTPNKEIVEYRLHPVNYV